LKKTIRLRWRTEAGSTQLQFVKSRGSEISANHATTL
jgi:hypothetical protein